MKPVAWFLAVAMLAGCASAAAKATVKFRKLQEGAYAGEDPADGRWFPCWPDSYRSRPEYVPVNRWQQLRSEAP